ncbi:efflux RND transporter periplasmic adaptor subunit [Streptomyces sp. NPDC088812]|uniref:efflux RND transporter periplasmic adaptor subunit n=1 Tax=Streptomyces sp. NPDC088812 TaxID=3365905 RepID=UPI0038210903
MRAEPPEVGEEQRRRRPRRIRRGRIAAVTVALIAAGGATAVAVTDPFEGRAQDNTAIADTETSTSLAEVVRGSLSERTQENGTLGYSGSYDVVGNSSGTLTHLPSVGEVIRQGDVLYRVDGKPVFLLKGSVPLYRELSRGLEGADVRQLNAALVALGYAEKSEIDPDSDYFSRQTRWALMELQDDLGLEETGRLALGDAVFLSTDEIRVTKVDGVRGGRAVPGQAVLSASSTGRQVTVALNASRQSQVAVGDEVTITLPNGKTTAGTVSSVGKVATKDENNITVEVKIKPLRPEETGELDQAPVQVAIVSDTTEDVLSVPVEALLARAGGGYAVEVVDGEGVHRLVPVKTGLFDDSAGTVEVSGSGLSAGQKVVVPGS